MFKFTLFSVLAIFIFAGALYTQNDQNPANSNNAVGPAPQATQTAPAQTNPNETILKYEQFLRDETKLHREYTQQYYTNLLLLIGAMGTILGTVLAWLNWKSKEDIRKQVEQTFKEKAGGILDEKFGQLDALVIQSKEKFAQLDALFVESKEKSELQFDKINQMIFELSAKSVQVSVPKPTSKSHDDVIDADKVKGKNILWVDNRPSNNDYPRTILEQAGINFTLALSTDEALEYISRNTFDLIISDMGRPEGQDAGVDLLKKIRKKEISTPVIIYSTSVRSASRAKDPLDDGALAVISNVTGLLSKVYEALTSQNLN
jgi:CheY-like chemotaxis protein